MAKVNWFYAQGDEEFGPVSSAQLKELATAGQLQADDLVWREGMDDWRPSREVAGLFPAGESGVSRSAAAPAPAAPAAPATTDGAAAATPPPAPPVSAPMPQAVAAQPAAPVPAFGATAAPAVTAEDPRRARMGRRRPPEFTLNLLSYGAAFGQPMLLLGLVLVLGAKGCDAVANRAVVGLQTKSQYEQRVFSDAYDTKRMVIEDKEQDATARQKQLRDLNDKRTKEEQELRRGRWRNLDLDARYADLRNKMWGYWREVAFVLGTMILAVGLLSVGFSGEGAERWICLIMLAIVTFSLYIGGAAWISSLSGLLR